MKKYLLMTLGCFLLAAYSARAHCQVPCGIYDDRVRLTLMYEHIDTIEKSMKQIEALAGDTGEANQLTRWVLNKEEHVRQLSKIVTYYFMAQRIKPPKDGASAEKYQAELGLLHGILVHAMKAKQTTDEAHIKALREKTAAFGLSYFGKE